MSEDKDEKTYSFSPYMVDQPIKADMAENPYMILSNEEPATESTSSFDRVLANHRPPQSLQGDKPVR
jgi:hypothetical protein